MVSHEPWDKRQDIDFNIIYLTCRYIKSNGGTRIPSPATGACVEA